MCGIAGFFLKKEIQTGRGKEIINKMLMALERRGPNGKGWALFSKEGAMTSSFSTKDHESIYGGFCHTRLSILDLSSHGSQPMYFGDYSIIFNGEVYNFQEIRNELIVKGYSFQSHSDTEVVLKAYVEWGEKALDKFRGMFALAIFNSKTREIFCTRDRIGIKPFYYYENEEVFVFASDVTSLIASGLYEPEIDWLGVKLGTLFQGAPRPLTCYKGVFALEPASILEGKISAPLRTKQYWAIPLGEKLEISERQAILQLEEMIHESVKLHLISDIEVATLMSGGIDSTTLSAFACILHPKIKAFTLTYDPKLNLKDEVAQAKAFASLYPFQHILTQITQQDVSESLEQMVPIFEEPIAFLEPHYAIAKHISEHGIKVVLNGLGPDELLGGYGYYRLASLWSLLKPFSIFSSFVPSFSKFHSIKKVMEAKSPYDLYFKSFCHYLGKGTSLFSDETDLMPKAADFMMKNVLNHSQIHGYQDAQQAISYADLKIYIGTHHNHTTDRFLMHFGIEGRFPFLDHKIVEFCVRLPQKFKRKFFDNQSKYLLRQVAKKYSHPDCLKMKKLGFGVPESMLQEKDIEGLKEKARSLKDHPAFNPLAIERAISSQDSIRRLLYLANFAEWQELFIKKKSTLFLS